jgi:hypothetical protein
MMNKQNNEEEKKTTGTMICKHNNENYRLSNRNLTITRV